MDYSKAEIIRRSRLLARYGIRTGDHRVFWVSYPGVDGQVCREVYRTAKQAYARTNEIAKQRVSEAYLEEDRLEQ